MKMCVHVLLSSVFIGTFLFGNVSFVFAATPVALSLQSTEQTLSVSWTVPADATAQEIRYATAAMDESSFSAGIAVSAPSPIPSASQSLTISGLQPSTGYFVGYRYTDTVGDSAYSFASLGTLVAPQNLPPAPVSGLSASASTASISLSWTVPADNDLSQYEIRYGTAPMTESSFTSGTQASGAPLPIAGAAQSFSIAGLSQGTTYYMGIRVLDTVGNASAVAFISATTQTSGGGGGGGGVSAPPPVTSFIALGGAASARLAWHTPSASGLSEFDVRYATTTIGEADFAAAPRATGAPLPLTDQDQEFTVSGLIPSIPYFFAIKTVNTVGMSSPLVTASTTVSAIALPPVSNLSAVPGMGTIDVRWYTPTSTILSMFEVRIAPFPFTASSFASGTAVSGAPLPLTDKDQGFTITGLSLATSYTIGVRIVSTTGDFSEIRFVSATTQVQGGGGGGGGGGSNSIGGGANSVVASTTPSGSSVISASNVPASPVRRVVAAPRARPFATIITIRPYKLTVTKGDSVTVTLVAHPEDSRKYGADVSLSYPPELLALESVEYGAGWTPSYEEGRNTDDAARGMVERSISFPSGFLKPLRIMTLTFIALENGEGALHTTDGPTFVLRGDRTPLRMEALLSVVPPSVAVGQNLFADLLSVVGDNNITAFASTFVFFFVLYMAYLAIRDKKRDGFISFIR